LPSSPLVSRGRRRFTAHEQGDADQTLAAADRDFRSGAVFHYSEQRNKTAGREIKVADVATGFLDRPFQRHWREFQIVQQARVVLVGQGRENFVLSRGMG